jgi:hypothetical protein
MSKPVIVILAWLIVSIVDLFVWIWMNKSVPWPLPTWTRIMPFGGLLYLPRFLYIRSKVELNTTDINNIEQ